MDQLSNNRQTRLHLSCSTPAMRAQRIDGDVKIRFRAQSLDKTNPATWAVGLAVVSRDGKTTLAELVPFTVGSETFPSDSLVPWVVGPIALRSFDCPSRSRISVEIGSAGNALIQLDHPEGLLEFSADLAVEDEGAKPLQSRYVGRCIYCPATHDLTREHIVPEGLNGEWTLLEASCPGCRDITSRFELNVLRKAFGAARASLGLRTKHPKRRPTALPLRVKRGGTTTDVLVTIAEHPTVINLPVFPPPGSSPPSKGAMQMTSQLWLKQVAGPPLVEVLPRIAREHGYDYVGLRLDYEPIEFARVITKIAYGVTVLRLGLDAIDDAYVLPAILGDTKHVSKWVGCAASEPVVPTTGLHGFQLEIRDGEIHAFIRLFAQFDAPEYHVIVGRMKQRTGNLD
jgi:hypothetical protein